MTMAGFLTARSKKIVAEWAEFARTCVPAARLMDLEQRCDHVEGMLKAIARDLETPQTAREQVDKSKGKGDAPAESKTAANAHGTDRAAMGYTPQEMVSEFRALRASVLRLWSAEPGEFRRSDLEEVTRFNEAIDQLLAESIGTYARDVDRSKDLFLGILGHDLRNPLGAIMLSASTMIRKEEPDWPNLRTATRILNSGRRMDAMIRDLVDFTRSRLGAGIPIVRADMDLEEICRETVEEIAAFRPGSVVEVEASGPLRGQWDAGRIAQVVSNLVGNAYEHGTENKPVKVAARGEPERVVLTVHNEGPAIPPEKLQEIFDPFRQLEPSRAKSKDLRSAGLGLYIVQSIVIAHAGTIEVASGAGGTTFTVRLPRAEPTPLSAGRP